MSPSLAAWHVEPEALARDMARAGRALRPNVFKLTGGEPLLHPQLLRCLEVVRTSGSHHRLIHKEDPARATTVPVHKGRDLPRPVLRAIIRQAGMTVEKFVDLL